MEDIPLHESERLEAGLSVMRQQIRLQDNQLRILIFTACYFVLDGVSLTIRRLASHLRSRHAIVKIVTTATSNVPKEQITDDIIIVPCIEVTLSDMNNYSFGYGLPESVIKEIERFKPNCIHFTVPDFVGLDGIKYCQKNNIPYIGTWHSNYADYLKFYNLDFIFKGILLAYLRSFYERIPIIYVPSEYMISKMESMDFGIHTKLIEWGRGVDMDLFNPECRSNIFRQSKGIQENDVVILWVGRLVPEKQPDIWFEVLERLANEGYPVKGLVVGNGDYALRLAELPHVKCCGWLSGSALAEAYASSDILLFPSAVETFGNVTLEALASGCVCIVETLCGKHLVEHRSNGFTCTAGDNEAFYLATKNLVEDTTLRKQMSIKARESARKFDRNVVLQQMAEHYKDAIVRHQDPSYMNNMLKTPIVAGQSLISTCCCQYYFIKTLLTPLMTTANSIKTVSDASVECLRQSRSKLNLGDLLSSSTDMPREDSRFEAELPSNNNNKNNISIIQWLLNPNIILRLADIFATIVSYAIVIILISATFLI